MSGSAHYEEQNITRDKNEKWLALSVTKHDDGLVLTGLDITQLKQAENQQNYWINQLETSQETIKSLEQMRRYVHQRGEFLRSTTHDLRGSFGVLIGATTLLGMMDTEEERNQTHEMLGRSLHQVTNMLNQLLDYSRLEAGQEQLQLSQFDAGEMLHVFCESTKPMAGENKIRVFTNGERNMTVEGDMVKIRRIVQNLVLNAIKYNKNCDLTVSWFKKNNIHDKTSGVKWVVVIEDTGAGISQGLIDKLNRVTMELASIDSSDHDESNPDRGDHASYSGEGIGLFIVQRLCELLSAGLEIESEKGRGTKFTITFPL